MDPDRLFPMPRRNPSRSQPPMMSSSTPEPQTRPIAPSTIQYQQPSLPSIRQLHPYLPPYGARLPWQESYSYPPPCAGPFRSTDPHPSQAIPSQSGIYLRSNAIDSDLEGDVEQQGPAKKKRRRQALSLSCNGTFVERHIISHHS
ncbi:hypothetical protein PAXINDRAFT_88859 [Paxillus involutus ATCC 200175]|uniref:Uncharacterized protein n=1 Tax=Paxillus involutus ATCC 200175 TaxID=664439 RepID=A0A0C9TKT7_PAXIN|nr:hypothetical protein PAXINDRAFT_88859 [Paxillus involutus ATCC 200175]